MSELPRVAADINPIDLADLFDEHGGVIIENLISADEIELIKNEILLMVKQSPLGLDEFEGKSTTRTGGLIARSKEIRKLVANPLILAMIKDIFGDETAFQVNQGQLIAIGPGESPQPIHRDDWLYGQFPFPPGYTGIIQSMWALTPFTKENGATLYVPGSHALPELTQIVREGKRDRLDYAMNSAPGTIRFTPDDAVQMTMDEGSVALWSGKLYHGGGNNLSDEVRWGMNIGYTRGWIRQEENQYVSMSPEEFESIDDDMARLLGWNRSGYGHGYAGDMQDPLDVARGRDGHKGFGDPESAPNKLGDV
jgi:ectoine hydroxylase-related dioxygenase (phytanoyl-CoA dioxygenase family)